MPVEETLPAYLVCRGDVVEEFGKVAEVVTHPKTCPGNVHLRSTSGKMSCYASEQDVRITL